MSWRSGPPSHRRRRATCRRSRRWHAAQAGRAGQGPHFRISDKLRTYLRVPYQCAIDARVSASIPVAFTPYGVQSNPAALTERDRQFDSADRRPLTTYELRAYWRLIEKLAGCTCTSSRAASASSSSCACAGATCADAITTHDAKARAGRDSLSTQDA